MNDVEISREFNLPVGAANSEARITTGDIHQAMMLTSYLGSIDRGFNPQREDSPGNDYFMNKMHGLEPICGTTPEDPAELAIRSLLKQDVRWAVASLPEREAGILRLMYGMHDGKTHTLDDAAQVYGVTRERIRHIKDSTFLKLLRSEHRTKLASYIDSDQEKPS